MARTLYLIEARASKDYACASCGAVILRNAHYFRHDPHPQARRHRGETSTRWCRSCVEASKETPVYTFGGRIKVPVLGVSGSGHDLDDTGLPVFHPLRVELVQIGTVLADRLALEPTLIHSITPDQFEELVCDRLFAMGLEPKRVGSTFQRDGGIDIVFWPRLPGAFPLLGAAQVKHHREGQGSEGPRTVREFAGSMSAHQFNAGILVTNTGFTADAQWFAREHAKLVRLRGFEDVRRWLFGQFGDEGEWREIPSSIELCPGVTVRIRESAG